MKLLVEHILQILGAQVRRMRVEGPGQARQVNLQQFTRIKLVEHPVAVFVPDRELANRFALLGLVGPELQQVELDLLPPPLVGFFLVDRVVDLVRVVGQVLIGREVELLLEQFLHRLVPLVAPLKEPLENPPREVDVAFADLVVELRGFLLELRDVRLEEVELLGVEVLEEIVAPFHGDLVVDHRSRHVLPLEQINHGLGRFLILVGRGRRLGAHNDRHEGQDGNQRQRT